MTLCALTVRQPWAAAIAHHGKDVENRTWTTSHRGLIAIHAAAGVDSRHLYSMQVSQVAHLARAREEQVRTAAATRGAVIAVACLSDVCAESASSTPVEIISAPYLRCGCGRWAVACQYHWHLTSVRALPEPVPAKGALGVWTLPDEVEDRVRAQLDTLEEVAR